MTYNEFTLNFDEIINYKAALRKSDMLSLSTLTTQLFGIIDSLKKDADFNKEPGYKSEILVQILDIKSFKATSELQQISKWIKEYEDYFEGC